jgi:hypothetical protein
LPRLVAELLSPIEAGSSKATVTAITVCHNNSLGFVGGESACLTLSFDKIAICVTWVNSLRRSAEKRQRIIENIRRALAFKNQPLHVT